MARISSPDFRLFSTSLELAYKQGKAEKVVRSILPEFGVKVSSGEMGIPHALRWTSQGAFGLPRQPFKVWRREKFYKYRSLIRRTRTVNGVAVIDSPNGELYRAEISVDLSPGQQLLIKALDKNGNAIPGQQQEADSSGTYVFRSPFMKKFHFLGSGRIVQIRGVFQSELINDPSWELIQEVGFPFRSGHIGAPSYEPDPQGWTVAGPMDPRDFGFARLLIGQALHEDPPALPVGGLPNPVWAAPDPGNYLYELADHSGGILNLVEECLINTDDRSPDPNDRQPAYLAKRTVDGLRQDGFPGTIAPATALIPVVSTVLLSAGTDNYASLGLGYGTYDFPPYRQENNEGEEGFDYMVTNTYLVRPFESSIFPGYFAFEIEFAALSEFRPRPDTPNLLQVSRQNQNRPIIRDAQTDETVQLRFNAPDFPEGYGVIKSDSSSNVFILNDKLLFSGNAYHPYIPNIPNPENSSSAECTFTDSTSSLPLHGTETSRYFLAAVDLFGRWSNYSQRTYTAQAIPPQRPGLTHLRLKHVEPLASGYPAAVACTIELECTWDWTERTPDVIQIGGGFYPADQSSPPSFEDRFAHDPSNAALSLIEITFADDGTPSASGADHEVFEIEPNDASADPNLRRYKVIASNVTAVFPGPILNPATPPALDHSRVAYAAVARALEKVRKGPPEAWSPWVNPVVDQLDDPRPPVLTPFVAKVNWTALPDAANVARGKLHWSPVPRAAGYIIWEAPETALREFLGLAHRPDDSLVDRATEITLALADPDNERDSLKAFTRLNRDPISETSVELSLPGSADTLFVYRISAVSVSNVESDRSNATFFAVPRQNIPGQPRLKLQAKNNGTSGIEVIALHGAGPTPAGYKVYRVRKQLASNIVQMKGLPVILDDHTDWNAYQMPNLDGAFTDGMKILDPVATPSWKPYYYQVVAVGPEDLPNGLLRGESVGSPTEEVYFPPENPPVVTLIRNRRSRHTHFISFSTNIPFDPITLGTAMIEILSYQPESAGEMPVRRTLFSSPAHKIKETSRPYRPHFPPLPDISVTPDVAVQKSRQTVYVRMNKDILTGIISVRDPLGRTTEIKFDEP
jgi:hypothetical protein